MEARRSVEREVLLPHDALVPFELFAEELRKIRVLAEVELKLKGREALLRFRRLDRLGKRGMNLRDDFRLGALRRQHSEQ